MDPMADSALKMDHASQNIFNQTVPISIKTIQKGDLSGLETRHPGIAINVACTSKQGGRFKVNSTVNKGARNTADGPGRPVLPLSSGHRRRRFPDTQARAEFTG